MSNNEHSSVSLRNGVSTLVTRAIKDPQYIMKYKEISCVVIAGDSYKEILDLLEANEIKIPDYFKHTHSQDIS